MLKFQWHRYLRRHRYWRQKVSKGRMFRSRTFTTKTCIIGRKRKRVSFLFGDFFMFWLTFYYWHFIENILELIGFTEFLSNTGGLLGLFMGFSVFSIIEVFYFLTLRPYSNYMKVSRNRRLAFERMFKKFKRLRSRRTVSALMAHHVERMEVHENNIVYPYVG